MSYFGFQWDSAVTEHHGDTSRNQLRAMSNSSVENSNVKRESSRIATHRTSFAKILASGTISSTPDTSCGIGEKWWNDRSDVDHEASISTSEFHLQDLIVKLSNTSLPITKSMTCNTNRTSNDDWLDGENLPNFSMSYNPCQMVVERFTDEPNMKSCCSPHGTGEEVELFLISTEYRQPWRCEQRREMHSVRTPQIISPMETDTADDMSSLAATAANEFLDCVDASSLVTSPPYLDESPQEASKSIVSCSAPIHDRALAGTSTGSTAKSLLNASFSQVVCGTNDSLNALDINQAIACSMGFDGTVVSPLKAQREVQYWKLRLEQSDVYQKRIRNSYCKGWQRLQMNYQASDLHFNLGQTYMKTRQYDLAVDQFKASLLVWQQRHGKSHVTVARAMDAIGLAFLRQAQPSKKSRKGNPVLLKQAHEYLQQAFAIRYHRLGVWHVDTVETYNKLASVHLHLGELQNACQAYQQVFLVRRAIFGGAHPSVAVSAHALANVYYKLQLRIESLQWYQVALKIYENDLQLNHQHPTVAKLLKDFSRL